MRRSILILAAQPAHKGDQQTLSVDRVILLISGVFRSAFFFVSADFEVKPKPKND